MEQPLSQKENLDDVRHTWDSWWNPTREERAIERKLKIELLEYIEEATAKKKIKPKKNPATPGWPVFETFDYKDPEKEQKLKVQELAKPHKRTIEKLAYGPCKGMKACIERSLWALWGVDTLDTSVPEDILGVNSPVMDNYYFTTPPLHVDQYVALYYGHIVHANGYSEARVIPASWLSEQDRVHLFNFYRWELEVLASKYGARLFDPQSPARAMLRAKIMNELNKGQTTILIHFLRKHRFDLLRDPEGVEKLYACHGLNKEIAVEREKADPSNIWSDSYFLHALFLEALKHQDVEILTNRRILYNSLWVLDQKSFADIKKKEDDLSAETIVKKINEWMPLAYISRENDYVDEYDMLYSDLLPRDLRTYVINLIVHKIAQKEVSVVGATV